ncbi:hypothetical protein BDR03DRAFT_955124 [Suillus americanus]|nr:hypothetical protein BDR03DRAFT_955124 [Suillus americanus]
MFKPCMRSARCGWKLSSPCLAAPYLLSNSSVQLRLLSLLGIQSDLICRAPSTMSNLCDCPAIYLCCPHGPGTQLELSGQISRTTGYNGNPEMPSYGKHDSRYFCSIIMRSTTS